jgi:hypothetical protein
MDAPRALEAARSDAAMVWSEQCAGPQGEAREASRGFTPPEHGGERRAPNNYGFLVSYLPD